MRPRIFLRTTEFLWQEGHTAHATQDEAVVETKKMLAVYQDVIENVLAMAVIPGEKSKGERFPGADMTTTVEAMMQDRKALQAGTSHYLGQNFAKASQIKFLNQAGEQEYAYTTSWGASTRLLGGMIMSHGDDDGLRVPPKLAPKQVVILPVIPKPELTDKIYNFADKLCNEISKLSYDNESIRVTADKRDLRGGDKSWQWIKKGIPVRIEVGPRDIDNESVVLYRRDKDNKEKHIIKLAELNELLPKILTEIQAGLYEHSKANLKNNTNSDITDFNQLVEFFTPKNREKPEIHGGFVRAKWSGLLEEKLAEHKLSIRCIPFDQSGASGKCLLTGQPATQDIIIAKSY
jgi:prolyl-tRNA synthetase